MNVASLELCKELYELSGWQSEYWYIGFPHLDMKPSYDGTIKPYAERAEHEKAGNRHCDLPAYTADYLLRKLQDLDGLSLFRCHHQDNSRNWEAECDKTDGPGAKFFVYADTPEDSLAKLAINLHKQGVLKKERGLDE